MMKWMTLKITTHEDAETSESRQGGEKGVGGDKRVCLGTSIWGRKYGELGGVVLVVVPSLAASAGSLLVPCFLEIYPPPLCLVPRAASRLILGKFLGYCQEDVIYVHCRFCRSFHKQ